MAPENQAFLDWEQQLDFEWLVENLDIFRSVAVEATARHGRGAVAVDLVRPPVDGGNLCIYWPQNHIDAYAGEAVCGLVREYDPEAEVVVMLLKPGDRISAYRLRVREQLPLPHDRTNAT